MTMTALQFFKAGIFRPAAPQPARLLPGKRIKKDGTGNPQCLSALRFFLISVLYDFISV